MKINPSERRGQMCTPRLEIMTVMPELYTLNIVLKKNKNSLVTYKKYIHSPPSKLVGKHTL